MRSFLLGAKTEVKSWTNPYVTDGLVAMWDGEWNAGGGVHDASASEWTDLVGGGGSITIAENYSWDEKALVHNSAGNIIFCANDIEDFAQVEYVCAIPSIVNAEFFGIGNEAVKSAGAVYWGGGVGISRRGSSDTGFAAGMFASASVSAVAALNIKSAFVNGVETAATAGSSSSWANNHTLRWSVGGERYHPATQFKLRCVRIYSRALTASEIAANYAVDQRRFGL